jgi:Ca2+-binding EF-hand superfamily protein
MRDELRKYNGTNASLAVSRTNKTSTTDARELQNNLRMSPEAYSSFSTYFDRLDTDGNGRLHEVEFVRACGREAKVSGQDVFEHFASGGAGGEMNLREFLRFAMIVLAKPSDFRWSEEDLKHLPTWKVWQDQDRLALLKLFLVFDANTDGKITIVEFENGWMGPLLWKLRQEDVVSSAWMAHDKEFQYANHVFDKRSGEDLQLNLVEWVHLLYEAREKAAEKSACVGPYHLGLVSTLVSVMQFVVA